MKGSRLHAEMRVENEQVVSKCSPRHAVSNSRCPQLRSLEGIRTDFHEFDGKAELCARIIGLRPTASIFRLGNQSLRRMSPSRGRNWSAFETATSTFRKQASFFMKRFVLLSFAFKKGERTWRTFTTGHLASICGKRSKLVSRSGLPAESCSREFLAVLFVCSTRLLLSLCSLLSFLWHLVSFVSVLFHMYVLSCLMYKMSLNLQSCPFPHIVHRSISLESSLSINEMA
jgi:hypothetical protein